MTVANPLYRAERSPIGTGFAEAWVARDTFTFPRAARNVHGPVLAGKRGSSTATTASPSTSGYPLASTACCTSTIRIIHLESAAATEYPLDWSDNPTAPMVGGPLQARSLAEFWKRRKYPRRELSAVAFKATRCLHTNL